MKCNSSEQQGFLANTDIPEQKAHSTHSVLSQKRLSGLFAENFSREDVHKPDAIPAALWSLFKA